MVRGPFPCTVIQRWFDESPGIRSAGTRKQWRGHIGRLERRYPAKRIDEYTADDLHNFLLFDRDGRATARAHTTIATQRCALMSFFGWAHFVGLHPVDVTSTLKRLVTLKPRPVRKHVWLQKDELEAIFQSCYRRPVRAPRTARRRGDRPCESGTTERSRRSTSRGATTRRSA
jgi:hypothetical protein